MSILRALLATLVLIAGLGNSACAYPVGSVIYGGGHAPTPPPLTVSLSPGSPAFANATFTTTGTYTTNAVIATPSGGSLPYSYAWTYVSGSATPSANTASASSTTFSAAVTAGTTYNSTWRVTVTDNASNTARANVSVNFTPNSVFPLDALARGIVGDNIMQTSLQAPAGSAPNYTPTPKVVYCTVNTSGVCTSSADMDNMVNAGITYMRIPIDAVQLLVNLPYQTDYLQLLGASSETYNSGTGLVTITASRATNLVAGDTTTISGVTGTSTYTPKATGAFSGVKVITVDSVTNYTTTSTITDTTTPSAIPGGTTITGINTGTNTLTLSANVTGMLNNDVLSVVTTNCIACASLNATYTATDASTVTFAATAGQNITSLTKANFSNIWLPMASNSTRTPGNPTGCSETYYVTTCIRDYDIAYLDTIVTTATGKGLAVNLVPFGNSGVIPTTKQMVAGSGFVNAATTGDLHQDMGTAVSCYGFSVLSGATCFEQMVLQANTFLVTRYLSTPQNLYFEELLNEPDYKTTAVSHGSWQEPALWNVGRRAIDAAIRAIDANRWIIDTGVSAGKAQFLYALTPTTDAKTVYSFHKYDPATLVNQTSGSNFNPELLYPAESSGGSAIGRPGSTAPAGLPSVPTYNTPSWQTVDATATCSGKVWTAGAALIEDGKQACVKGGGGAVSLVDFYTPSNAGSNIEFVKDDLLNNTANGIQLAINWAANGGHGIGIKSASWASNVTTLTMYDDPTAIPVAVNDTITVAGVTPSAYNGTFTVTGVTSSTITYAQTPTPGNFNNSSFGVVTDGSIFSDVKKIIVGEIGQTGEMDYRSRLQFDIDIRATLEAATVPGGQVGIPYDWWAYSGLRFGIRPKGGGPATPPNQGHNCLGTVGGVAGVDLDYWDILTTPQSLANVPHCTASTRADYGTPGLP